MKILFCPSNYPPYPGGISSFSKGIVDSLRLKNYDVVVIYDNYWLNKHKKSKDVIYFFNIKIPYLKVIIRSVYLLYACLKHKPDVLFFTNWKAYCLGIYIVSSVIKIPYFIQVHGTEILNLKSGSLFFYFAKKIFGNAKAVLPNSNYTSKLLWKFSISPDRLKIFHPGVYPTQAYPPKHIDNKKIVFFAAARLIKRKGIDKCIKALAEIPKHMWEFRIAGEGPESSSLKNLCNSLNLSKNVIFLGEIPYKNIYKYFIQCDVFLLTSMSQNESLESFGIVYLEANLFGKPVIGTAVGGVPDAIVDGHTGFLIQENNHEELKSKLFLLINDERLRKKLGLQGRERVIKEFIWTTHINQLIKVFNS